MAVQSSPTQFASAERSSDEEIRRQFEEIEKIFGFDQFLNSMPNIVVLLNENRQIVYFNKSVTRFLDIDDINDLLGFRPGEILDCVHARNDSGGCGTAEQCRRCGAVLAILTTQQEQKSDMRDCLLTRQKGDYTESLDLRVWTDTIDIGGRNYVLLLVQDISDEKRRKALERIFFHDIRNTAGNLLGFSKFLIKEKSSENVREYLNIIYELSEQLMAEISSQSQLIAAENDELEISCTPIDSRPFIEKLVKEFQMNHINPSVCLKIDPGLEDVRVCTDKTILQRIVLNMMKNAIEAEQENSTATVGCNDIGENRACFWVHNPAYIPRDAQLQIFKRSFSTKGANRGLGTYGMKLLGEKYLKGNVYFRTDRENGTVFSFELPKKLETQPESSV